MNGYQLSEQVEKKLKKTHQKETKDRKRQRAEEEADPDWEEGQYFFNKTFISYFYFIVLYHAFLL